MPRGERPMPITRIFGSTAFSASYERASMGSYAAPETPWPLESYCGCQNRGWLGSFPITKSFTAGYVRASSAQNCANLAGASGELVRSRACVGTTAKTTPTP